MYYYTNLDKRMRFINNKDIPTSCYALTYVLDICLLSTRINFN